MRGQVECQFVGGPEGTKTLLVPAIYCRETLVFNLETWFAARPDGGVDLMKGRRDPASSWISYAREVFRKAPRKANQPVTYRYVRTEEVHRCAQMLYHLGRRCGHDAQPASEFCPAHDPKKRVARLAAKELRGRR